MTSEISFVIPEDQTPTLSWLKNQDPALTANLLQHLQQICQRVSCPDLIQIQKDHEREMAIMRQEHSQQMAILTAERDTYKFHLEEFTRQEVCRQIDELRVKNIDSPNETFTEDDMVKSILAYYSGKKRLPRNIGDVFPLMSDEERKGLMSNPILYDSALAKVKHDHYKTCGKRSRPPADV